MKSTVAKLGFSIATEPITFRFGKPLVTLLLAKASLDLGNCSLLRSKSLELLSFDEQAVGIARVASTWV